MFRVAAVISVVCALAAPSVLAMDMATSMPKFNFRTMTSKGRALQDGTCMALMEELKSTFASCDLIFDDYPAKHGCPAGDKTDPFGSPTILTEYCSNTCYPMIQDVMDRVAAANCSSDSVDEGDGCTVDSDCFMPGQACLSGECKRRCSPGAGDCSCEDVCYNYKNMTNVCVSSDDVEWLNNGGSFGGHSDGGDDDDDFRGFSYYARFHKAICTRTSPFVPPCLAVVASTIQAFEMGDFATACSTFSSEPCCYPTLRNAAPCFDDEPKQEFANGLDMMASMCNTTVSSSDFCPGYMPWGAGECPVKQCSDMTVPGLFWLDSPATDTRGEFHGLVVSSCYNDAATCDANSIMTSSGQVFYRARHTEEAGGWKPVYECEGVEPR